MAGKGGGAWKVAYADFVTAMMAFFLVMWITSQDNEVKQAVAQYFHDPLGTSDTPSGRSGLLPGNDRAPAARKGPGMGGQRIALKAGESAEGAAQIEVKKPSLFVLHGGDQKNVGTVIQFTEDGAELDERAKQQLDELAPMLSGKRNKIEIRGHASRRPLPPDSPYKDAWQLSYARCLATIKHLETRGVELERFRMSQAGGFEPYSADADAESQAKNSRVEVYLLGEFVDDFGEKGKKRTRRADSSDPAAK